MNAQTRMSKFYCASCIMGALALLLSFALPAHAQTPVSLAPVARQQFFSSTGIPLAGGCVSTFAAGTSTPLATYADVTGQYQNANPLTLDAGGFGTIYLANAEYKIQVNAAPASGSCASNNLGAQIYVQDNVSAYQIVNGLTGLTFSAVTSDPSGVAGEIVYRSDLPCFRGFTTLWDCFVQAALSQTLTNKTINPANNTISGGTAGNYLRDNGTRFQSSAIQDGDVTSYSPGPLANNSSGTTQWGLVKLVSGPTSQYVGTTTSDTHGAVGICVSGCGTSGNPTIVASGYTQCQFDDSTQAGDYFQISNTGDSAVPVATECHDIGPTYPSVGQIVGRVLGSSSGAPLEHVFLFPPEIQGNNGYKFEIANLTPVTVANTASATNLIAFTMPANEIGTGQTFYFDAQGIIGNVSAPTLSIAVVLDGTTICAVGPTLTTANTQPWALHGFFTGLSTGSSGSVTGCHLDWSSTSSGGGHIGNESGVGFPAQSVTVNTTVSHTFSLQVMWGTASTSNTVTQNTLIIYRIG